MTKNSPQRPRSALMMSCVIFGAGSFAGCSSVDDALSSTTTSTQGPAGIYQGTLTPSGGTAIPVVALIDSVTPQPHIVTYSTSGSYVTSGLMTLSGTDLSAQTRYFDLTAATTTAQVENINGYYEKGSLISGTYTLTDTTGTTVEETGTLVLDYDLTAYQSRSALSLLANHWVNVDQFGTDAVSFSIDSNGDVTGNVVATGCSYTGTLGIINLAYNLYSLSMTESCPSSGSTTSAGTMTGLATILPASAATNNLEQLVMGAASSSAGILFQLVPASS